MNHNETIINALKLYHSWMDGLSRVSTTFGNHEDASRHAVEAYKATQALEQIGESI